MPKVKKVTPKKKVAKKVVVKESVVDNRCRKCRQTLQGATITAPDGTRACSLGCSN
tara:strand:+ start:3469 stop:3636 length:168 start_codon:yes stop_codon:yes gene_type:complete